MKNLMIAMIVMSILALASVAAVPQFGAKAPVVSVSDKDFTITGTILDAAEGTNVQLFCGSETSVSNGLTDINGAYTIKTVYGGKGCNPGPAVLKAGEIHADITIPGKAPTLLPTGGSSPEPEQIYDFGGSIVDPNTTPGVPEFSILTLGIAVVGVGLGLALLRKHN